VPYLFIEIALRDIGPLSIAAARVALAALVMAPFLLHRQRRRAIPGEYVWGDGEAGGVAI
jgi:hypothetical protein